MDRDDIWYAAYVVRKLEEATGVREVSILTRLDDVLGDSLDTVEFIMSIEEDGFSIPDDEFERIVTIQDLIDAVKRSDRDN